MITIEKCSCGHPSCRYYWLVGIGSFVQGSGFTQEEAQRIADLLNTDPISELLDATKLAFDHNGQLYKTENYHNNLGMRPEYALAREMYRRQKRSKV